MGQSHCNLLQQSPLSSDISTVERNELLVVGLLRFRSGVN